MIDHKTRQVMRAYRDSLRNIARLPWCVDFDGDVRDASGRTVMVGALLGVEGELVATAVVSAVLTLAGYTAKNDANGLMVADRDLLAGN